MRGDAGEIPCVSMQERDAVVQRGIARVGLEHLLVADDLLGQHLGSNRGRQLLAFLFVRRHDLEPQFRHLVGRALTVSDPARRAMRVVRILR
jgi:hypothetical protein